MFDNLKKFIIDNYKSIICFVCIILFLALAENVFNNEFMKGDVIGYQFVSNYLIKDNVTPNGQCALNGHLLDEQNDMLEGDYRFS